MQDDDVLKGLHGPGCSDNGLDILLQNGTTYGHHVHVAKVGRKVYHVIENLLGE
jgi:hypothetical protein